MKLVTLDNNGKYLVLGVLITIVIFIFDLFTFIRFSAGILYVGVILLSLRITGRQYTIITGIISTLLIVLAFFILLEQEDLTRELVNRSFALIGIWTAVSVILKFKYSEELTNKNKKSLDALFQFSTEGILIVDSKGKIVIINPMGEQQFGYEQGELHGQNIEQLVPKRFAGNHVQHRNNYYQHPYPRAMGKGMELYGRRKDGTEFPVEISLSSYRSSEGLFTIAFIIDITERKVQTDAIKLANKKLMEFTTQLKASNSELENFAYISSHDLQEPLRKIQSFGDRIKTTEKEKLSEQGKDYLERMLNAATRMQTLINDLLAFSRLTTKALPFVRVDLNNVFDGVLSDLEVTIQQANAIIEKSPLPIIDADETQMRQLFQNLITNAIKFRKKNSVPWVKIDAVANVHNPDKFIDVHVEDNGIGFDEKYLEKIFNIFQRLDGQKYEGSGIGLAVCKKIAVRHGGDITAKSKEGSGSTFIVTLPFRH